MIVEQTQKYKLKFPSSVAIDTKLIFYQPIDKRRNRLPPYQLRTNCDFEIFPPPHSPSPIFHHQHLLKSPTKTHNFHLLNTNSGAAIAKELFESTHKFHLKINFQGDFDISTTLLDFFLRPINLWHGAGESNGMKLNDSNVHCGIFVAPYPLSLHY